MKKLRRPSRFFRFGAGYCTGTDPAGRHGEARNYIEVNGDGAPIELREMKKLAKWVEANIKFIEQEKKRNV